MNLTEDEAKRKWCPMVRQSATFSTEHEGQKIVSGFSYNRSAVENPPHARCIGSECMMWRWGDHDYDLAITDDQYFDDGGMRFVSPPGEGWERQASGILFENLTPFAREQFRDLPRDKTAWRRLKRERGYCGLVVRL